MQTFKDKVKEKSNIDKMRETITNLLRTSQGINELASKLKSGGFKKTLPEVAALIGLKQGEHHPTEDAFEHTIDVLKKLPKDATDNIRWAALLHDIGKAETQVDHPVRGIVFDGHEEASSYIAPEILDDLRFDPKDKKEIIYMIAHHGALRSNIIKSPSNIGKKFIEHPHFDKLMTLHLADVESGGHKPDEILASIDRLKSSEKKAGVRDKWTQPNLIEPTDVKIKLKDKPKEKLTGFAKFKSMVNKAFNKG